MHFVVLYCTCSRYVTKKVGVSGPSADVLLEHVITVKSCFAGRCSGIFRLTITEVPCDTFFLHVLLLLT
jgi:hypothetical protein